MNGEDFLDFYTEPVEHIRLKGTRIGFDLVVKYYNDGMRPEEIAESAFAYPIPMEQLFGSLSYYFANKQKLDEQFDRDEKEFQKRLAEHYSKEPPEVVKRLMAIKAERQAVAAS